MSVIILLFFIAKIASSLHFIFFFILRILLFTVTLVTNAAFYCFSKYSQSHMMPISIVITNVTLFNSILNVCPAVIHCHGPEFLFLLLVPPGWHHLFFLRF